MNLFTGDWKQRLSRSANAPAHCMSDRVSAFTDNLPLRRRTSPLPISGEPASRRSSVPGMSCRSESPITRSNAWWRRAMQRRPVPDCTVSRTWRRRRWRRSRWSPRPCPTRLSACSPPCAFTGLVYRRETCFFPRTGESAPRGRAPERMRRRVRFSHPPILEVVAGYVTASTESGRARRPLTWSM